MVVDSSATETGISVKRYREKGLTDDSNVKLEAVKPVGQAPRDSENKADDKPATTRRELTWAEVLTATFTKKITDWRVTYLRNSAHGQRATT